MAADEILVQRVRTALERAPNVQEKKMFGGLMFLVDGGWATSAGIG